MKIDVNQKKISIGDKYKIFVDEVETYNAAAELFKLLAVINLKDMNGTQHISIKKKWKWWGAKYLLQKSDGREYLFTSTSVLKPAFECLVENNLYTIYAHRGRKYSVFKNDKQVASWQQALVTWFNGDNYAITADDNIDKELIISFCLAIDNYSNNDSNKSSLNINPGTLFQVKKFDENWRPNMR